MIPDYQIQSLLEEIVLDRLSIPTLDPRGNDFFDFHEISVWSLFTILKDAYEAGYAASRRQP